MTSDTLFGDRAAGAARARRPGTRRAVSAAPATGLPGGAPASGLPGAASSPSVPDPAGSLPAGPVWFGGPGRRLMGWVHVPPVANGASAVLCPPVFGEEVAAQFAVREVARRLAGTGLTVVRFDYPGTGNSAGATGAPDLVAQWFDGIDRAVELARCYASGPVALIGMRVGAVLAALAAQRRGDIDALVLWDPCDSGKAFLRRQRSLHALHFGPAADGTVEVPGAALSPAAAADLSGLRLPATSAARWTLVLDRPGQRHVLEPGPSRGPAATGEGTATATATATATGEGTACCDHRELPAGEQEALLEVDPLFRSIPAGGMSQVVEWLADVLTSDEVAPRAPCDLPVSVPAVCRSTEQVLFHADADADGQSAAVAERVRWLGPAGLFAIETVPADRRVAVRRPVVVFLPEGNDRHTGSGRLWVLLARRWAAAGVRCLRVDFSGLGESPARPGRPEEVIRAAEAFADVADVVAAAAEDPRDVVLVGLCSSGYQALEGAVAHDLRGVLAVNPVLRFIPPESFDGGPSSPLRQICVVRSRWVTRVRARLPERLAGWGGVVRARLEGKARTARRLGWQQRVAQRGVRAYCLCGPVEAGPLIGEDGPALRTPVSGGHVVIDVAEQLDHALLPERDRMLVADRLTAALEELAGT